MINLPTAFQRKMKALLQEDYDNFLSSLSIPAKKAIYINENKISVPDFRKISSFDLKDIDYEVNGFLIGETKLGRHPLHHAGAFYVQEPSAMFTVNCLPFKQDWKVLDMCAAPGGKTIQMANKLKRGVLISNEVTKSRNNILCSNIERMGLKNVIVTNETPSKIALAYSDYFDVVLVDAPCSGEGMFRRGEEVIKEWNENLPEMCMNRQIDILEHASNCLKQDGYLIYSTCTYSIEENERVIDEFVHKHDYELIYIDSAFGSRGVSVNGNDYSACVRLYPHNSLGEGQFVALLRKKEKNHNFATKKLLKINKNTKFKDFFNKNMIILPETYDYKGNVYILDTDIDLYEGINYTMIGVMAGCLKNSRIIPHHNLFTAFGTEFKKQFCVTSESSEVKKYLKGEQVETGLTDGYGVMLVDGIALGGFKISDGQFKNHYPKGLRNF